ncbi:sugar transferase [Parabacteroides sp. PF5-9]|uniref:sugar transferase n=1 Tax=Parabacteroides sp. PF5-9 TaxID=1742404 RepID=UPI002474E096|nr:sugar transferase [Parabacteroides sp. PF5-9]MDH6358871.1 exopolysaccharide biosynthesis polyprenyl glycosylphosphotransferase [Parabacteroides sp. PF5-9]
MNKNLQRSKYILTDLITAALAWLIFNLVRYYDVAVDQGFNSLHSFLLYYQVLKGQIIIPFFWLVLYYFSGYYNKPFGKSRLKEFFSTLLTVLIGVVLVFFVVVLNDLPRSFEIYYELFFALLGIQFFMTYIPRLIITQNGIRKIKRRDWALSVLIIGAGKKAAKVAKELYDAGYEISGFISEDSSHIKVDHKKVFGGLDDLPEIMEKNSIHELVIAVESMKTEKQLDILYSLYRYKCPIKMLVDNSNILSRVNIKTIYGAPLIDVTDNNFSEAEKNIKLFLDKFVSIIALILLLPVFIYLARRVKKDSPGPVFFKQERIGYRGKPFMIYKIRTMYTDSENDGPLLSAENDPRITPLGQIMRKYRIDELPQFWNVLKGDMSLVGPRPERKFYIDQIVKKAPYYYLLHNVRPGITSLGMVKYGYAGDVEEMIERLHYDILYYENMSLTLDITILINTVKTVVTGKGI